MCTECRRPIDHTETVIVETGGLTWRTSLERNPVLRETDVVRHVDCAPARDRQTLIPQAA
jgi:hypothetical protein